MYLSINALINPCLSVLAYVSFYQCSHKPLSICINLCIFLSICHSVSLTLTTSVHFSVSIDLALFLSQSVYISISFSTPPKSGFAPPHTPISTCFSELAVMRLTPMKKRTETELSTSNLDVHTTLCTW